MYATSLAPHKRAFLIKNYYYYYYLIFLFSFLRWLRRRGDLRGQILIFVTRFEVSRSQIPGSSSLVHSLRHGGSNVPQIVGSSLLSLCVLNQSDDCWVCKTGRACLCLSLASTQPYSIMADFHPSIGQSAASCLSTCHLRDRLEEAMTGSLGVVAG